MEGGGGGGVGGRRLKKERRVLCCAMYLCSVFNQGCIYMYRTCRDCECQISLLSFIYVNPDSCQYSYSDRKVKMFYSYGADARNVYGHGNVTVTLVCGRSLVSNASLFTIHVQCICMWVHGTCI